MSKEFVRKRRLRPGAVVLLAALLPLALPQPAGAEVATLEFETYPDGTATSDGDVVISEFADSHDVRFPDSAHIHDCGATFGCDSAASGDMIATGAPATEFSREPIGIELTALKRTVTMAVSGFDVAEGRDVEVSVTARDSDGAVVDTDSVEFTHDGTFSRSLAVSTGDEDLIAELEVSGGTSSEPNFIAIDDLTVEGEAEPGEPDDVASPQIHLFAPDSFERVESSQFDAHVVVEDSDSEEVAWVRYRVEHVESGDETLSFDDGRICGVGAFAECGNPFEDDELTLDLFAGDRTGEFEFTLQACDAIPNCSERSRTVVLEPPEPPPAVRVIGVELNQGTARFPNRGTDGPEATVDYSAGVGLISDRDLIVRLYLAGEEERDGVSLSLVADIDFRDGSEQQLRMTPNAPSEVEVSPGVTELQTVDVPEDPGDDEDRFALIQRMRLDLDATLNFVIPGERLRDAERIRIQPWDGIQPVGATVRTNLGEAPLLGMRYVEIRNDDIRATSVSDMEDRIIPYLGAALPVREARVTGEERVEIGVGDRWDFLPWRGPPDPSDRGYCSRLLSNFASALRGDTSLTPEVDAPLWNTWVGLIPGVRNGCAKSGDPDKTSDRLGGVALTFDSGDYTAHELGHTMGLSHADGTFGSKGAEDWPYPTAFFSPDPYQVAGVFAEPDEAPDPGSPGDAGTWDLALVLPCTNIDGDGTASCPPDDTDRRYDDRRFETMSYGSGQDIPGLEARFGTWPSDITYERMRAAMYQPPGERPGTARFSPATGAVVAASGERIEGLVVSGVVDDDGTVGLYPAVRKPVFAAAVDETEEGSLTLALQDGGGADLAVHRFDVTIDEREGGADGFTLLVPFAEGTERLEVRDGTETLAEAEHAGETVAVRAPDDERALQAGPNSLVFEATQDAVVLVHYREPGADTWSPVAYLGPGAQRRATVDLTGYPSREVELRLLATDGFIRDTETVTRSVEPVQRLAGPSRVDTAVALSSDQLPGRSHADTVVLARADRYPDALAGAPLAAQLNAPLLLTSPDQLDAATAGEIARLGADHAVLLGGEAALSAQVADDLARLGIGVERLAGRSRFETAGVIGERLLSARPDGPFPDRSYVVEGIHPDPSRGWPDAVAVASLAARQRLPVLLTDAETLPEDTQTALGDLGVAEVTVVGGAAAVSDDVVDALKDTGLAVERVAGATRFETAAALAERAIADGADPARTWLATGDNWPDALAAAPAVAANNGVLLLVSGEDLAGSPPVGTWLEDLESVSRVVLVGGTATISPAVEQAVRDLVE